MLWDTHTHAHVKKKGNTNSFVAVRNSKYQVAHHRFLVPLLPLADLLKLLLICGKCTVGVLSVGPYSPKFLAVADFRRGLTLGKGLKTCGFGFPGWGDLARFPLSLDEVEDSDKRGWLD